MALRRADQNQTDFQVDRILAAQPVARQARKLAAGYAESFDLRLPAQLDYIRSWNARGWLAAQMDTTVVGLRRWLHSQPARHAIMLCGAAAESDFVHLFGERAGDVRASTPKCWLAVRRTSYLVMIP